MKARMNDEFFGGIPEYGFRSNKAVCTACMSACSGCSGCSGAQSSGFNCCGSGCSATCSSSCGACSGCSGASSN